jgi:hypothetical protein
MAREGYDAALNFSLKGKIPPLLRGASADLASFQGRHCDARL